MDSWLSVAIMISNYSHDIATAFLAVSGLSMWILSTVPTERGMEDYYIDIYQTLKKFAGYSLIWIIAAGVPRVIFYMQFEWADKAGSLQVIAVVIKHIVMFSLVGMGLYYWTRLDRKAKLLKKR